MGTCYESNSCCDVTDEPWRCVVPTLRKPRRVGQPQQQRVSSNSQLSSSKLDFTILRPIWFAKIESRRKWQRNYASLGLSCCFCLHRPQYRRKCHRQSTRLQTLFALPRPFLIATARLSLPIKPASSTASGRRKLRAIALFWCSMASDITAAPTK